MTGPQGNSEFCFPRISMFPTTQRLGKHWQVSVNKIHCCPRDQSLSDCYIAKQMGQTGWFIDKWRATAVNISRVTVNCFPFDVIVFAMLLFYVVWRETVSFLDVMGQWTGQWMSALYREKRQLYNNSPLSHGGHIVPGDQKSFVLPRIASQSKPWGEAKRGKTKLFWSPGTIWPSCDKGEWLLLHSDELSAMQFIHKLRYIMRYRNLFFSCNLSSSNSKPVILKWSLNKC